MFDRLLRRLHDLEGGVRLTTSIPLDDEGYLDRACSSPECGAEFKVLHDDWRDVVSDDAVHCPTCGYVAASSEWLTGAQREHVRTVGMRYLMGEVQTGLADSARAFNRAQPRGGFIQMQMAYRPGAAPLVVPASAGELLRQKWTCDACGCRYASLGAAFFCPACGRNSAPETFEYTVSVVRRSLDAIPEIAKALEKGEARDLARHVIENGFVKLIGAFQRLAEALYSQQSGAPPARRNVFQTIDEAGALWRAAVGRDYEQMLGPHGLRRLTVGVQQRHLLVHRDGIVDQEYLARSGDASYQVGQRIVVQDADVRELAELLTSLAAALRSAAR